MSRPAWFATLPGSWTSRPLGYSFDISLGKMVNAAKDAGEAAPYLAAGSIQPKGLILDTLKTMAFTEAELRQYDLRTGDIVVVEGGAGYGRSLLLKEDLPGWGFQNHVARLRAAGAVEPAYAQYSIQACVTSGYIEASNRTATLPSLSREVLRSLVLPHPPLSEQRAIADFLDSETAQIDTLIAKQERLVRELGHRLQSVRVRLCFGLDVDTEKGPPIRLIDRHLAVEPLLGKAPRSWRVERFKAILQATDVRNESLSAPMASLRSTGQVVLRSTLGGRQEPDDASLPRYLVVEPGDLVVNPMWLVGGGIGFTRMRGAVSPDYRVFHLTSGVPAYFHELLRSQPYLDQYQLYTRSTTTFDRRVQQAHLNNLPVLVPPIKDQQEIARAIGDEGTQVRQLITKAEHIIELSRERRSALITAAVTGQIDVSTGRAA